MLDNLSYSFTSISFLTNICLDNVETSTLGLSTEQSSSTETISYSIGSSTEALASSTESADTSTMASTIESEGTTIIANTTESEGTNTKASSADMGPALGKYTHIPIVKLLLHTCHLFLIPHLISPHSLTPSLPLNLPKECICTCRDISFLNSIRLVNTI